MDQSGKTSIASSHGTVCTKSGSGNEASKPRPCRFKPGVHDTRDPAVQPSKFISNASRKRRSDPVVAEPDDVAPALVTKKLGSCPLPRAVQTQVKGSHKALNCSTGREMPCPSRGQFCTFLLGRKTDQPYFVASYHPIVVILVDGDHLVWLSSFEAHRRRQSRSLRQKLACVLAVDAPC
jgi:hypothetical protein